MEEAGGASARENRATRGSTDPSKLRTYCIAVVLKIYIRQASVQRDEFANQLDEYLSLSKTQLQENYENQVTLYESRLESKPRNERLCGL